MYKNFFGFKERPFQLVPNPAYLFLSKSHEEALAHLAYAVSQGDGFVEITGEVGTGKTTLCRVFLENLDKETEAAYIFNPKLDSIQLLKAINDEFGIDSDADNAKVLIDRLNEFLMVKKAEGLKVILLIDEAQNLSMEILEQLRLLSNLETSTSKLLQIILVGQPELGQMLDSYELRQLGQRITLSCHLTPLNYAETREYIRHRLQIAALKNVVRFTPAAYWTIYKYANGIPRLINIACDRTLLMAYGMNRHKITAPVARAAIRELAGRGERRRKGVSIANRAVLMLGLLALVLALMIAYLPGEYVPGVGTRDPIDGKGMARVTAETAQAAADESADEEIEEDLAAEAEVDERPEIEEEPSRITPSPARATPLTTLGLEDYLMQTDPRASRLIALRSAVNLWNPGAGVSSSLSRMEDVQDIFRLGAKQNGMLVQRVEGDLNLIRRLDLPAIFPLYPPGDIAPVYLTLSRIEEGRLIFKGGEGIEVAAEPHEVESFWGGMAFIPWKDFYDFGGVLPREADADDIVNLKMLMGQIGFTDIGISPVYDDRLRQAVEIIQERNGVTVDGVVGPITKIILYNELKTLGIPHLIQSS